MKFDRRIASLGASIAGVSLVAIIFGTMSTSAEPATASQSEDAKGLPGSENVAETPNFDMARFESYRGLDRCLWDNSIYPGAESDTIAYSPASYMSLREPARSLSILRAELLTAFGDDVAGTTVTSRSDGQISSLRVNVVAGSQVATLGLDGIAPSLSPSFGEAVASLREHNVAISVAAVADQGFAAACPLWESLALGNFWSDAGIPSSEASTEYSIDEVSGRLRISVSPELLTRVEAELSTYGEVATVDDKWVDAEFSIGSGRMPLVNQ